MTSTYARKMICTRLEDVIDLANKDKSLSPDIQDQLVYLTLNEAWELTLITNKFRQQLQRSLHIHYELERAIRMLEYSIQYVAMFFDINTLFICTF
jgi:hypothetical protein